MKNTTKKIVSLLTAMIIVLSVFVLSGCQSSGKTEPPKEAKVTGVYVSGGEAMSEVNGIVFNPWPYDEVLSVETTEFGNLILSDDGKYILIHNISNAETMGDMKMIPYLITVTTFGTYTSKTDEYDPELAHIELSAANRAIYYGGNTFFLNLYGYLDTGVESTFAAFDESQNMYAKNHDALMKDFGEARSLDVNLLINQIITPLGDGTFTQNTR